MTAKRVTALLVTLIVTGCSSSGSRAASTATPPAAKPAPWEEYCRYSAVMVDSISRYSNGTLDEEGFVEMLSRYQEGFVRIAGAMSPPLSTQVRALASSISPIPRAIAAKTEPDYSPVRAAVAALPACKMGG